MKWVWAQLRRKVVTGIQGDVTCGGQMTITSRIERGQRDVVERILRHCSLWEGPIRSLGGVRGPPTSAEQASDEPPELQLALGPEYL